MIPHRDESQVIWESANGKLISLSNGWTLDKPRSDYRHYSFYLEIPPKLQAELSSDYVLQLTMDAIGQDVVSKTIYVKDWSDNNLSPIGLKPFEVFPLEAQEEIDELKRTLASYEKTNERLGRHNQKYEWLIELAKTQQSEIDKWVVVDRCERGDLNLQVSLGSAPTVRLCIFVKNKSRLDISLSDELDGVIKFQGTELLDKKKVINSVMDATPGEVRCLTIEQRLTPSDVQMLADAQHALNPQFFNFDGLKVQIIGGQRFPDVSAKSLVSISSALAFPLNLLERGQRIRALSEIRGNGIQLYQSLKFASEPLPREVMEQWEQAAHATLEQIYDTKSVKALWHEVTSGHPIPNSATSQRQWMETFFVNSGALLAELTGEYGERH
jgi:hypothetical protein